MGPLSFTKLLHEGVKKGAELENVINITKIVIFYVDKDYLIGYK